MSVTRTVARIRSSSASSCRIEATKPSISRRIADRRRAGELLVARQLDQPCSPIPAAMTRTSSTRKSRSPARATGQGRRVEPDRADRTSTVVDPVERDRATRAGGAPRVRREPVDQGVVMGVARRAPQSDLLDANSRVPQRCSVSAREARARRRASPRVVRRPGVARGRPEQDEPERAVRIGSPRTGPTADRLGDAEVTGRSLPAASMTVRVSSIRVSIRHPLVGDPVREAHAALLEQDEPGEGRQRLEPGRARAAARGPRYSSSTQCHHEVDGAVADDLVGDVDPAGGLGVAVSGALVIGSPPRKGEAPRDTPGIAPDRRSRRRRRPRPGRRVRPSPPRRRGTPARPPTTPRTARRPGGSPRPRGGPRR